MTAFFNHLASRILSPFLILVAAALPVSSQTPQILIRYSVNDTDAATVAAGSIPNYGTLGNGIVSNTITLSTDVPSNGVTPGGSVPGGGTFGNRSLAFNGTSGILAPGSLQLNRTNISQAGRLTFEAWIKWNGRGNLNSIIDYAGTERLVCREADSTVQMEANSADFYSLKYPAPANEWHYVAAMFIPTNTVTPDDSLMGNFFLFMDGVGVAADTNVNLSALGDTLNRTIGVGMNPSGATNDYFNGLIYEPRISLGDTAEPSPGGRDIGLLYDYPFGGAIYSFVTTTNDTGGGSLRAALGGVSDGDVITFNPSLSGQTIVLNSPIETSKSFTLDGSGLAAPVRISGNYSNRIFTFLLGRNVVLNSVALVNGKFAGNPGGCMDNLGTLTMSNCTIASCSADNGGAIVNNGTLTLNNCSFYTNAATSSGGVIYNQGALAINNCTFSGNSANAGGAIWDTAGMTINNSTIVGNSALTTGGGIYEQGGQVTATNTIICQNTAADAASNLFSSTVMLGTNNLINTNAQLSPLGNYGGSTLSMPPLIGSPAVDAGTDSITNLFTADQRGLPRLSGAHVDIGAAELQNPQTSLIPVSLSTFTYDGSVFYLAFTNIPQARFSILTSTNPALPLNTWSNLGPATETAPGSFFFSDRPTSASRYYRIRSP